MNSLLVSVVILGLATSGCQQGAPLLPLGTNNNVRATSNSASHQWATAMERPGLPNLYKVSDDLYRGAQPTAEGVKQLEALGVKTIINVRSSDTDLKLLTGTAPSYEHISMTAWNANDKDVLRFLQIVTNESRLPAFVHCRRGADRTGLLVAVYRVVVQDWDKEAAIAEMTQGGFHFFSGWQNLVNYVRNLDVDAMRQRAGLAEPALVH